MANTQLKIEGILNLDLSSVTKSVNELKKTFAGFNLPPNLKNQLSGLFSDFDKQMQKMETQSQQTFNTMGDVRGAEKSYNSLKNTIESIVRAMQRMDPKKINIDPGSEAGKRMKELDGQIEVVMKNIDNYGNKWEAAQKKIKAASKSANVNVDISAIEKSIQAGERNREVFNQIRIALDSFDKVSGIARVEEQLKIATREAERLKEKLESTKKGTKEYDSAAKQLNAQEIAVSKLAQTFEKLSLQRKGLEDLRVILRDLTPETGELNIVELIAQLEALIAKKDQLSETQELQLNKAFEQLTGNVQKVREATSAADGAMEDFGDNAAGVSKLNSEMNQLQSRVEYVFSITNGFLLMRRAVQQAYQSIVELDSAMTDIAVVTDMRVGDLWKQLDEYARVAQSLGATTAGAYEVAQIYYQQGLTEAEVFAARDETLKFARTANLDYATATDTMTAAVRGFNLEMSDAVRINDIFSNVAAKSASSQRELSEALTRTASIAHNAGMSIETTVAFLAQMIETTRESPENLGTAMKTVIARFQELKKAPEDIELIDGEMVDANRVESALKSVGIALRDNVTGQFRELEGVFIELASKWDTLDKNTQRYIATIAAGSRQQSRFIAMMSNFERTSDMIGFAYDSAGAGQEQFEKTLDSMESKINALKVAFQQFVMGITNSTVIKGAVDILTLVINAINKLTGALGSGVGGILKFLAAIGGFSGAKKLLARFFNDFQKLMKTTAIAAEKSGDSAGLAFQKSLQARFKKQKFLDTGHMFNMDKFQKEFESFTLNTTGVFTNFGEEAKLFEVAMDGVTETTTKAVASSKVFNAMQKAKNQTLVKSLGLTEAQIGLLSTKQQAQLLSAIATGAEDKATRLSNEAKAREIALNKGGLIGLLTNIGISIQEIALKKGETVARTANIKTIILETAAQMGLNSAMFITIGAILAIVAAIGLLIFGVVKLIQYFKSFSPEEKLRKAEEATRGAQKAADEASNAYDDLLSKNDQYEEARSNLEDLTKGTDEWRKALIESNKVVLSLLAAFPELAKYITSTSEGFIIEEDGFKEVIAQQESRLRTTQGSVLLGGTQKTSASQDIFEGDFKYLEDWQNFLGLVGDFFTGEYVDEFTSKEIEAMERGSKSWNAAIRSVQSEFGLNNEEAAELLRAQGEREIERSAIEDQKQAEAETFISSTASPEVLGSDYGEVVINAFSQGFLSNLDNLDDVIEKAGRDADPGPTTKKTYEKLYKQLAGVSEIPEEFSKKADLRMEVGRFTLAKEYEKNLSQLNDQMAKIERTEGKERVEEISGILSKDGSGLTLEMVNNFEKNGSLASEKVEGIFNDLGMSLEDAAELLGYDSADALQEALLHNATTANEAFNEAKKTVKEFFGEGDTLDIFGGISESLTSGEAIALSEQLREIALINGTEVAENLLGAFSSEFEGKNKDILKDAFSELAGADLTTGTGIYNLKESLKEAGVDMTNLSEVLDGLNGGFKKLEVKQLEDATKGIDAAIKAIGKGEQGAVFEEETYNALVSAFPELADSFVMDLEGNFVYVGGRLDSLALTLEENTKALLQSNMEDREDEVLVAELASGELKDSEGESIVLGDIPNWGKKAKTAYLTEFMQQAEILEIDTLKAIGLAKETDLEELSRSEVNAYIERIRVLIEEKDINLQEIESLQNQLNQLLTIDELRQQGASDEEQVAASLRQAQEQGLDSSAVLDYAERLQELRGISSALAAEVARSTMAMDMAASDLTENWEEWSAVLKNAQTDLAARETQEYSATLTELRKNMQNMFGITHQLSDGFFQNAKNIELMEKAAYGDADAIEVLRKSVTEDIIAEFKADVSEIEGAEEKIQALHDFILDYELPELKAGASIDDSNFYNTLNDMIEAAGWTRGQVVDYFKSMGYDAEIEMIEQTAPGSSRTITQVGNRINPSTGEPESVNTSYTETIQPLDMMMVPTVKTLTSLGSAGGNVTTKTKKAGKAARPSGGGGGGGGGGGSSKKEDPWENTYDELYNLLGTINEEIRTREKLEWKYNRAIKNTNSRLTDTLAIRKEEENSLRKQAEYYDTLYDKRMEELEREERENAALGKYASFNRATNVVEINWDAINKVTNKEEGEKIEKYIDKLEEIKDSLDESEDALRDIEDSLEDLKRRGMNEYISVQTRLANAIDHYEQEKIDKLSKINETITNSNARLLNSMQKAIDEERSQRSLDRQKEDIESKQRRLALLKMDPQTYALEILNLEKEIANDQEAYTDSLVDKQLQELQEQNNIAAEQRDATIELLQHNKDFAASTGVFQKRAEDLLGEAVAEGGTINLDAPQWADIKALLAASEDVNRMGNVEKADWQKSLEEEIMRGIDWYLVNSNPNIAAADARRADRIAKGLEAPTLDDYNKFDLNRGGKITSEEAQEFLRMSANLDPTKPVYYLPGGGAVYADVYGRKNEGAMTSAQQVIATRALNARLVELTDSEKRAFDFNGDGRIAALEAGKILKMSDDEIKELIQQAYPGTPLELYGFKTGGLADFTGPAWLDGTPSRPELILKPSDTQNFLVLKDVLQSFLRGEKTNLNGKSGDNYYEVHIDVESIANDYDVEQVADKVKRLIGEDASYRNVNAIERVR